MAPRTKTYTILGALRNRQLFLKCRPFTVNAYSVVEGGKARVRYTSALYYPEVPYQPSSRSQVLYRVRVRPKRAALRSIID